MSDSYLDTPMGRGPERMEHWSCPDAETYLPGIGHYEHPTLCLQGETSDSERRWTTRTPAPRCCG